VIPFVDPRPGEHAGVVSGAERYRRGSRKRGDGLTGAKTGAAAGGGIYEVSPSFAPNSFPQARRISMGTGNTMVEVRSFEMSNSAIR
jgi:hypothetical protein